MLSQLEQHWLCKKRLGVRHFVMHGRKSSTLSENRLCRPLDENHSVCVRGCVTVLQGKCYDGTCQAGDKLFEVKSISPFGIPANNSEWTWRRFTAGSVGEVTTLASQVDLATPATVNGSVVASAPEDPRTHGVAVGAALKIVAPVDGDKTEAAVWYRNNTPSHPPGLFNGMKVSNAALQPVASVWAAASDQLVSCLVCHSLLSQLVSQSYVSLVEHCTSHWSWASGGAPQIGSTNALGANSTVVDLSAV
jgi:hypothetical protein